MDNNNLAAVQARARKAGTPGLPVRALVFSAVIFALSLMVYAGLEFGYKTYLQASINNYQKQIKELDRQAPAEDKEREFLKFYSQATNVQRLLNNHISVSSVFDFIERTTYPDVAYSAIKVTSLDNSVSLTGSAKGYDRLANQLAIYDNASEVLKIGISGSRYADGVIKFEGRAIMAADIFSFIKSIKVAPSPEVPGTQPVGTEPAGTQTIQP